MAKIQHGDLIGAFQSKTRPRLYRIWINMRQRCSNPKAVNYKYYGAKGVKVLWPSFAEFKRDMGSSYREGLTIDRIDNSGHYCKDNCRWATMAQQSANQSVPRRRFLFNGMEKTRSEWAAHLNMSLKVIKTRLDRGWTVERTLTTPVQQRRQL